MNNLKSIREEQVKISDIHKITSSLQLVASTQSVQFTRKKKNHAPIRSILQKALHSLMETNSLSNLIQADFNLHIICSCDQKFCKSFLVDLNNFISQMTFDPSDRILLFGSRSYKILSTRATPEQIITYKVLNTFEECESLSLIIKSLNYPRTYVHCYSEDEKEFQKVQILPLSSEYSGQSSSINHSSLDDFIHLFIASEIYYYTVQTALKERVERAMAMSEASSNAETKARELKSLYNKTRQSMITKEITSGS